MKRHARALLAAVATLLLVVFGSTPPAMAADATLRLTFAMPDDATALVDVTRVDAPAPTTIVLHTNAEGATEDVALPVGTYRITPRALTAAGVRHVADVQPRQVRLRSGATISASITWVVSRGVQNLVPTQITSTSIALDWDAVAGDDTVVWRVDGDTPTLRPGLGTQVALTGSSLTDERLTPGGVFSYSIFARPGDGAFGNTDGDPVTITVGTLPADTSSAQPAFITTPGTVILDASDIASVTPTGTGVRVTLAEGVTTPAPDTAVTLPVSDVLEGGYLGEVVDISDDGRTILLAPTSMSEAFAFYHLEVPDITEAPDPAPAAAPAAAPVQTEQQRARQQRVTASQPWTAQAKTLLPAAAAATGGIGGKLECSGLDDGSVTPHFSTSHAGHANITIDTYRLWFVDVPNGVGFDVGYSETVKGTMDITSTVGIECGFALPKYAKQLTTYPVPLAVMAEPIASVSVTGGGTITNLGFTATLGFQTNGHLGLTGSNSLSGKIINTAGPTEPKATSTVTVGLGMGGAVNFGPGVGTKDAGVIVGIAAELLVVDASLSVLSNTNGLCLKFQAQSTISAYLTLRAWLPGFNLDRRLEIDALTGEKSWGEPWYWPNDCEETNTPTNDVVGPGVTPIGDDVTGSQAQWGKIDGFVPGQSTWVLSSGRVSEAVGSPGFFASTNLGQPGDASLSQLSGHATYDAASYTVSVIPNGQTLKVRFVFASEEYPEFVGSSFNDVMAVFVNGQNCAVVPGTGEAVAINTVNAGQNSAYYVDNAAGASGYGTSMDGLTKPLTCSVPVAPGTPVTIKIAVADASDAIYDSAIALLDGGIWSE